MPETIKGLGLTFTPEAKVLIGKMRDQVNTIRAHYGPRDERTIEATDSLARCLVTMIGLGGHVMVDGELSLICQNEHLVYGVNWSPRRTNVSGVIIYDECAGSWSVNS